MIFASCQSIECDLADLARLELAARRLYHRSRNQKWAEVASIAREQADREWATLRAQPAGGTWLERIVERQKPIAVEWDR